MVLQIHPIGVFHSPQREKYMAARQAGLSLIEEGRILLHPDHNFEQALQDLAGFDRIWVIYWFHKNDSWKPKVQTPREGGKRGLFATRSPHRPNPIGMSAVTLIGIQGRELIIGKNDLIDETPILDIKPYLPYADSFPESRTGWIEETEELKKYAVHWDERALEQAHFLEAHGAKEFISTVELRLQGNPFPFPSHRIRKIGEDAYELALKTWRVKYRVRNEQVHIEKIYSGYDKETLDGKKESRWSDVPLHREFLQKYV